MISNQKFTPLMIVEVFFLEGLSINRMSAIRFLSNYISTTLCLFLIGNAVITYQFEIIHNEFTKMRVILFWSYVVQSIIIVAASNYPRELCKTQFGSSPVPKIPSSTTTIEVPMTVFQKFCSTQIEISILSPIISHVTETKTLTTIITIPRKTDVRISTFTGMSNFEKINKSFFLTRL